MTQWKLTLSYDGTSFHGWQVQPGLATIQGTLAQAIEQITGETTLPQGSGRTDAGVHALAQVASVGIKASIPAANFLRALNSNLPPSIRVTAAEAVSENFHARYGAVRKIYEYRIFERRERAGTEGRVCSPFLAPYVWDCRWPVDFDRLQGAAGRLVGEHDFASFRASDPDRTDRTDRTDRADRTTRTDPPGEAFGTVRTVFFSAWTRGENTLVYRVIGNGFLHHMVRNLVGTMVDVGRGSLEPSDINRILAARDRTAAGPTAPASGLFLVSIEYPESPGKATSEHDEEQP